MRTSKENQLEALVAKRDQLNERIQKYRDAIAREARKTRNEQANVIGLAVLEMVADGEWTEDQLLAFLDPRVATKKQRDLFGLPPAPPAKQQGAPQRKKMPTPASMPQNILPPTQGAATTGNGTGQSPLSNGQEKLSEFVGHGHHPAGTA